MIEIPDWVSTDAVWRRETAISYPGFRPNWSGTLTRRNAGMFPMRWSVHRCVTAAALRMVVDRLPGWAGESATAVAKGVEAYAFHRTDGSALSERSHDFERLAYYRAGPDDGDVGRQHEIREMSRAFVNQNAVRPAVPAMMETLAWTGGIVGGGPDWECREHSRLVSLFLPPAGRVVSQDVLRLAAGWLDKWWTYGVDDHLTRQVAADALQEAGFADEERLRFLQEAPNCFPGVWPFVPAPAGDHKRSRPPRKETADAN